MNSLLLINVAGACYGIWDDALARVQGALPLHRLPLTPPAIAGIAILDDRSVLIADLAATLGFSPVRDAKNAAFLIIDPREKIAGFVVEGAVDRIEHSAEKVFRLPGVLATPVIDTCAVINDALVAIINIQALHDRLQQGSLELPRAAGTIDHAPHCVPLASFRVRAFRVGGERFCVNAGGTSFEAITRKQIAVLPTRNDRLAGIALHDGSVLPLVRMDSLLGIEARNDRAGMLVSGVDGTRNGLLVDEDLGIIEQQDLRINALPALARRSWMQTAAVSNGMVYPLIEADRIISDQAAEEDQIAPPSFLPRSEFSQRFRKDEVQVVEFTLLGAVHAVPKDEVKEVRGFLPISRIPRTTEIVMGVADLHGELLPVLDLAALFGRRSAVNKTWRLIRIANGDFHALVVAEEVRGDRRLSLQDQKQLPLAPPHQVLYGCYLDEGLVRLIMNVQSLAVHFEKAAVRELVTGRSWETAVPAVSSGPAERRPTEAARPDKAAERDPISGPAPVPADNARIGPRPIESSENAGTAQNAADRHRLSEDDHTQHAAANARREVLRQEEAEQLRKEGSARLLAEEQARKKAEEETRQKALDEQRMPEDRAGFPAEDAARARAEEDAREQERDAARRIAAGEARKRAAGKAERVIAERSAIASTPIGAEPARSYIPPGERAKGKRITFAAVIAAALVLILYFASVPKRPSERPAPSDASTEVLAPLPLLSKAKKDAPKAVPKNVNAPEPETMPPLYLIVPPERVILPEQEIYSVVKGDTLWGIAKRFTGNPLNYPRVARDNGIATPDLIFPGQRIRLVQVKR